MPLLVPQKSIALVDHLTRQQEGTMAHEWAPVRPYHQLRSTRATQCLPSMQHAYKGLMGHHILMLLQRPNAYGCGALWLCFLPSHILTLHAF
jgi:hypothetical protein